MHSFAWWLTLIAVLIVVGIATVMDLWRRRIPNWLVLPFLAAGIAVSCWLHGWHGLGQSLAGIALGLLIFGFFFWVGGMGAGDVKLCAAIGAWIGPWQLFLALIFTGLVGGVMALGWAIWGGFFNELLQGTGDLILGRNQRTPNPAAEAGPATEAGRPASLRRKMPYAPAIAIGTLISFFAR